MEIPREIILIIQKLKKAGFPAYIVGGCVRDVLRNKKPKDWDIATLAKPEEIQMIFSDSFYKNKFGTVTVKTPSCDSTLKEVEITTFRKDEKYSDKRHPDKISFAQNIEEDLSRRDFTINAMAIQLMPPRSAQDELTTQNKQQMTIIDPFGGQKDLKNKIIKTVGSPEHRFSEDALRLLRAVRFSVTLGPGWQIEKNTFLAIKKFSTLIKAISKDRIRDEFIKIVESQRAAEGVLLLHKIKLLEHIIPELEKGVGMPQNRHHIYTIFQHSILSLKYAAKYNYNLNVRLAALLHDIAKPQTKRGEGAFATFYNHDVLGARITTRILKRLRFPKKIIEKVALLVRYHMFYYDPEKVTESSVRRLLQRVGKENIDELIQVRICDRKGSGVPKAYPFRLRHFKYVLERVKSHPISVSMLKVNGNDVMGTLKIDSGPRVGLILNALLAEVIEDPQRNSKNYLIKRIKELASLSDFELKSKHKIIEEKKMEIDEELKKRVGIRTNKMPSQKTG